MKTISIVNLKGGVGKTVTAVNMAAILAEDYGKKVLVIDADPQANATRFYGISEDAKNRVMQVIRSHFRPEFLNRLDEIIMFNPLGYEQMKQVMRLQIDELNNRLKEQSILLEADDSALDKIMEDAYDPLYGARPLKRYIEQTIVTDLSKRLIAGTITPGFVYILSAKNGVFEYQKTGKAFHAK